MIYSRPGEEFVAVLSNAPEGLVGTLTFKIETPEGVSVQGPTTAGIVEVDPGVYAATRIAPSPTTPTTYVAIWTDPNTDPDTTIGEDLFVASVLPPQSSPLPGGWNPPAITQVAAYLPTRTKNDYGVVQKDNEGRRTFNSETEPTDAEVAQQIFSAVTIVQSDVGTTFCEVPEADGFPAKAQELAALYAAMLVELGFFPEQVRNNQSQYPQLKVLYDEKREALRGEVDEVCGNVPGPDTPGASGPDPAAPQWGGFEVEFGSGQW